MSGGTFEEMSAFFEKIEGRRQREWEEMKLEMERMRAELMQRPPLPREVVTPAQLSTLQARLKGLGRSVQTDIWVAPLCLPSHSSHQRPDTTWGRSQRIWASIWWLCAAERN